MFTALTINSLSQGFVYEDAPTAAPFSIFDSLAGLAGAVLKAARAFSTSFGGSVRLAHA